MGFDRIRISRPKVHIKFRRFYTHQDFGDFGRSIRQSVNSFNNVRYLRA